MEISKQIIDITKKTIRFNDGIDDKDLVIKISKKCANSVHYNVIVRAIEIAQKEIYKNGCQRLVASNRKKNQKKGVKKSKVQKWAYIVV